MFDLREVPLGKLETLRQSLFPSVFPNVGETLCRARWRDTRRVFDVACNLRSWNPKRRVNFQNGGHFKLGNGSKGCECSSIFRRFNLEIPLHIVYYEILSRSIASKYGFFYPTLIRLIGSFASRHNPLWSELVAVVLNSNSGFRSGATSLAVKTANVSCPQDQSTNSTVPTYSVYENSTKSYEACEKLQLSVPWSTTIQLLTLHTLLISVDILTRFVRSYSFFLASFFNLRAQLFFS